MLICSRYLSGLARTPAPELMSKKSILNKKIIRKTKPSLLPEYIERSSIPSSIHEVFIGSGVLSHGTPARFVSAGIHPQCSRPCLQSQRSVAEPCQDAASGCSKWHNRRAEQSIFEEARYSRNRLPCPPLPLPSSIRRGHSSPQLVSRLRRTRDSRTRHPPITPHERSHVLSGADRLVIEQCHRGEYVLDTVGCDLLLPWLVRVLLYLVRGWGRY